MEFEKLESYGRIHGVAHRRGAPAIGAPALTRQIVLTCEPTSYAAQYDPKDKDHPRHMKNHLTFLDWQKRNLGKAFVQLAVDLELPLPQVEKVNTLYQHFLVDGLFVKVILELYKDYLRVLTLVELEPPEDFDGYEPVPLLPDAHEAALAAEGLRDRLTEQLSVVKNASTDEAAFSDAHRFLREAFWSQLDEILCIDTFEGLSECKLLLDLRGCTFTTEDIVSELTIEAGSKAATLGVFAENETARKATNALWPLIGAGGTYENKEFVCCTLFRNSCLYISSIGSHIGTTGDVEAPHANSFFLATTPRGQRWQIGRLLYRINEVASYRLMAFKNLEEILEAGTEMNRIGSRIERLSDVEFKNEATLSKLARLQDLKSQIDRLGSTNIAELGYKIERSQYFSRRFHQAVHTVDTGGVEGWQPYNDFIERRLQPTFDKISDVGTRFDRLLKLYHAQLAELDSELQRQSIEDLVEIQTELLDSSSFQHRIESIALAYYGGTIAFTILFGAFILWPETVSVHALFGYDDYKTYKDSVEKALKGGVFVLSVLCAIGYFTIQEHRHHAKSHERKERFLRVIRRPARKNSSD